MIAATLLIHNAEYACTCSGHDHDRNCRSQTQEAFVLVVVGMLVVLVGTLAIVVSMLISVLGASW